MGGRLVVVLLLAAALAGCSGASEEGGEERGTVKVQETDGDPARNGTGTIRGVVLDDLGYPIEGVRVGILSTPYGAQTDAAGAFEIRDLEPFRYRIAFSHPDHVDIVENLDVEAGKVLELEVVLLPNENLSSAYRPHKHDMWGGETELTVIDSSWEWHSNADRDGPYAESPVQRPYSMATQGVISACEYGGGDGEREYIYFNNLIIWFDEQTQLVPAGTGHMELALDWDVQDYYEDTLRFVHMAPNEVNFTAIPEVAKGETVSIPVTPEQWDSSHQSFTLWSFGVCIMRQTGEQEPPIAATGSVDVDLKLFRMDGDIPPERGHPFFWGDNGTMPVVDDLQREISGQYAVSRSQYRGDFAVFPQGKNMVPPGTGELTMRLDWTTSGCMPAPDPKTWSLQYRSADIFPHTPRSEEPFKLAPETERGDNHVVYRLPLERHQTDAFYQSRSNWAFLLGFHGEEEETWVNEADCDFAITVNVVAHRDTAFVEG